jgi:hypothetical protein
MKVVFHIPSDPVFAPIEEAILKVFPNATAAPATPNAIAAMKNADLVIIEAAGANAAAVYLLGVADAGARKSLLVMPVRERLALFENRSAIIHGWNLEYLRSELRKLSIPEKPAPDAPVDDTPAGKFHRHFGDLLAQHDYQHRGPIELENENVFTLREQDMDLPLAQEIARRAKTLNMRVRLL